MDTTKKPLYVKIDSTVDAKLRRLARKNRASITQVLVWMIEQAEESHPQFTPQFYQQQHETQHRTV